MDVKQKKGSNEHEITALQFRAEDLDDALNALNKTAQSPRTKAKKNLKGSKNHELEPDSETKIEDPTSPKESPRDRPKMSRTLQPSPRERTKTQDHSPRDRSKTLEDSPRERSRTTQEHSPRDRSRTLDHSPRERPKGSKTTDATKTPKDSPRERLKNSKTQSEAENHRPALSPKLSKRELRALERKESKLNSESKEPKSSESNRSKTSSGTKPSESEPKSSKDPESKSPSKEPNSSESNRSKTSSGSKPSEPEPKASKEAQGTSSKPPSEPTSPRVKGLKRDKSKAKSPGGSSSSGDEKPKKSKKSERVSFSPNKDSDGVKSPRSHPKLTRGKTDLDLKVTSKPSTPTDSPVKPVSARETREKKLERATSLAERGAHGRRAIKTVEYSKSDLLNIDVTPKRGSRGSAGLTGEVRSKIDEYEKKLTEPEREPSPKRSPRDEVGTDKKRHAELKKTYEDITDKIEKDVERIRKKPSRPQSLESPDAIPPTNPSRSMTKGGSGERINYHPSAKDSSPSRPDRESFRKKISSPRGSVVKKHSKRHNEVSSEPPVNNLEDELFHAMVIVDLTLGINPTGTDNTEEPTPAPVSSPEELVAPVVEPPPSPKKQLSDSPRQPSPAGSPRKLSPRRDSPRGSPQRGSPRHSPRDKDVQPVSAPDTPPNDAVQTRRTKTTLRKPKGLATTDTTNDQSKPSTTDLSVSEDPEKNLPKRTKSTRPKEGITKTAPPERTDPVQPDRSSKEMQLGGSKEYPGIASPRRRESRGEQPRETRDSNPKELNKRDSRGENGKRRDSNPATMSKSEPPSVLSPSRKPLKRGRSLDNDQRPEYMEELLDDRPKKEGSMTARDTTGLKRDSPINSTRETMSLGGSGKDLNGSIEKKNRPPATTRRPSRHQFDDIPGDLPSVSVIPERKNKPRSMSSGQPLAKVELVRMDLDNCTAHVAETWRESPTTSSRSPKSPEQRLTEAEMKIARLEKLVHELTEALNYERSLRDKNLPPIGQHLRETPPRDAYPKTGATSMPSSLRSRSISSNDLDSRLRQASKSSSGLDKIEETSSAPNTPDLLRASKSDVKRNNLPELNLSRIDQSDSAIKKSYSMFTSRSFSSKGQAVTASNVFTAGKPYKTREVEFTCWILPIEKKQKTISNFDVASMVAYLQANRLQYLAELWTKSNEFSTPATKMWELRPGNEIALVGIPLKVLLEWLTTCPPAPLQALWRTHIQFPSCFFQVYQLYFKPLELFNYLANGPNSDGTTTPQLLFLWIHITQASEFRRYPELMSAFDQYITANPSPSSTNLREYMERYTTQPMKPSQLSNPKTPKIKPLDILGFDPEEFARQMCLLEQQFLFSCDFNEFLNSGWMRPNLSRNIQEYIAMSNKFIYCCTTAVLTQTSAEDAANVISYLIGVCQHLWKMKNLNSLLSTLSSLFSTPIQKLAPAWELVSKSNKEKYTELTNELNAAGNFKKYHESMDNIDHSKEPVVPIFSQALKNLFLLDEVVSNELPEQPGWINWEKMQKIARYIRGLKCWEVRYPFKEHVDIQEFFVNSVSWMNEDSNYAIAGLRKEGFMNTNIKLGSPYPIEYSTEYSAASKLFPPPSLSDRELEILTAGAQKVLYEANSAIISKGDPHSFLGYLIAGRISIESFNAKKKARECAGIIKPGSFFNLAGLLCKQDYVSQNWLVTCVEDDTTIFKIDIPTALKLCETEASLSSKLHQMLAFEVALEFTNQAIVKLTKQSLVANKTLNAQKPQQRIRAPSASLTESSQRNLKLNETFKLSGEIILKEFQCKLQQAKHSKTKDGILFISQNYVCFRTATGGFGKKKESFQLQFIRKASTNGKTLSIIYSEKQSDDKPDEYLFIFEEDSAATFLLNFWERKSSGTVIKEEHSAHFAFEPADRNLTVDDWEALEKGSDLQTFSPKSPIYSEKSCERVLWRLVTGTATLNYSSVYKTQKTTQANPGDLFGACSFILSTPCFCGLTAGDEKVEAKPISGYYLDILFSQNRQLASRFWYHTSKLITEELLTNLPPPDTSPTTPKVVMK